MFEVEKIRGEFPILEQRVYGKPLVYLDNGATAQKPRCVIERIAELYRTENANIHRGVHYLSERCTALYEDARKTVGEALGTTDMGEVIFTAGATAAINTVAYSYCEAFLMAGDNVVVSEMEHHSNIVPWQMMCLLAQILLKQSIEAFVCKRDVVTTVLLAHLKAILNLLRVANLYASLQKLSRALLNSSIKLCSLILRQ